MIGSKAFTKNDIKKVQMILSMRQNPKRNLMMFQMMLSTGARIGEVAGLSLGDVINPVSGEIQSTIKLKKTKNGHSHRLFVSGPLQSKIKTYTQPMSLAGNWEDLPLFPSQRNPSRPVSVSMAYKVINSACKETGVEGLTSHSARKYFATQIRLEAQKKGQNIDIEVIRELLNHQSLEITKRYFQASDVEASKAVNLLKF